MIEFRQKKHDFRRVKVVEVFVDGVLKGATSLNSLSF